MNNLPMDIILKIVRHVDSETEEGFLSLLNLCCVSKTINANIEKLPNPWTIFPYRMVLQSQLHIHGYGPKRLWITRVCNPMFGKTRFDISLTNSISSEPAITIYVSKSKIRVYRYGTNTPITIIPINRRNIYNHTFLKYNTMLIKDANQFYINKNGFITGGSRKFSVLLDKYVLQNTPPYRRRNVFYLSLPGLNAHAIPSNKNFKFDDTLIFGKVYKNKYECIFNHENLTLFDAIVMCFLPFV